MVMQSVHEQMTSGHRKLRFRCSRGRSQGMLSSFRRPPDPSKAKDDPCAFRCTAGSPCFDDVLQDVTATLPAALLLRRQVHHSFNCPLVPSSFANQVH